MLQCCSVNSTGVRVWCYSAVVLTALFCSVVLITIVNHIFIGFQEFFTSLIDYTSCLLMHRISMAVYKFIVLQWLLRTEY